MTDDMNARFDSSIEIEGLQSQQQNRYIQDKTCEILASFTLNVYLNSRIQIDGKENCIIL